MDQGISPCRNEYSLHQNTLGRVLRSVMCFRQPKKSYEAIIVILVIKETKELLAHFTNTSRRPKLGFLRHQNPFLITVMEPVIYIARPQFVWYTKQCDLSRSHVSTVLTSRFPSVYSKTFMYYHHQTPHAMHHPKPTPIHAVYSPFTLSS
jgi:hypothetical protein